MPINKDYYKLVSRFKTKLREAEGSEGGDEKLDQIISDLADNADQLSAALGVLPNYQDYIRNPQNPANDPEHNELNQAKVKEAVSDIKQYIQLSSKLMGYLESYIEEKYGFKA
ncbi:MAG TPA: hypothetical protein DF712_01705 [Balneola sp.]|nr:hypothetical protein [Balneola sp.]